jgi:hypothetical protein
MYANWADPELSRQLFENALEATAMSFLALAALVGILAGICILWECIRLVRTPPVRHSGVHSTGSIQIVYRSEKTSPLPVRGNIHA